MAFWAGLVFEATADGSSMGFGGKRRRGLHVREGGHGKSWPVPGPGEETGKCLLLWEGRVLKSSDLMNDFTLSSFYCGRNGNDGENEHAEAGAKIAGEYFTKNLTNPFNINEEDIPIIQVVIHYHEHKEQELGKLNKDGILFLIKKYNAPSDKISEIEKLCMLLKDADALDRERFATYGKLDPKYLRSKSAKTPQMLKYAKEINQAVAKEILKRIYGIENIKEEIDSVKLLEELKIKKVENARPRRF